MNQNKVVAIYARKSTESEEKQVLSIDSQIKELKELAEKQNINVDRVFIEAKSAKAPGRPVFNEMFKLVQRGKLDTIISWKLDRLARNPLDGGALIWALDQGQLARLITPSNTFTNSGNDKFWMQLEFGMAKKYVDDLSENVKRGLRAKLQKGGVPYFAPIGYLNDRLNRTVIPDPDRFDKVRRVWDYMLTGSYTISALYRRVTTELKLSTPRRDGTERGPMALSAFIKLLRNPFYYGIVRYDGEYYAGAHQPMITKAEFDRVQQLIQSTGASKPLRNEFTYTGMISCGQCAGSITAESKVNRFNSHYIYYHCTHNKAGIKCKQGSIEEKQLEDQILAFLDTISIPTEYVSWTEQAKYHLDREDSSAKVNQIALLKRKLTMRHKDIDELLTLRLRRLISDETFASRSRILNAEKLDLEQQLSSVDTMDDRASNALVSIFQFAVQLREKFLSADRNRKRTILGTLSSQSILYDKRLKIHAYEPFEILRKLVQIRGGTLSGVEPLVVAEDWPKVKGSNIQSSAWWHTVGAIRRYLIKNPDFCSKMCQLP